MPNTPSKKNNSNFEFKGELNFLDGPIKPRLWKRIDNWMSEPNPEGVTGYDVLFIFIIFGIVTALFFGGVLLINHYK